MTLEKEKGCSSPSNCLRPVQRAILGNIERFFNWYGRVVARYPYIIIPVSLLICGLCSIGLMNMESENDPNTMWLAKGTEFKRHREWIEANYPSKQRPQMAILYTKDASNILTGDNFRLIWDLRRKLDNIAIKVNESHTVTFQSECIREPLSTDSAEVSCASKQDSKAATKCFESHVLNVWANEGQFSEGVLDKVLDDEIVLRIQQSQAMYENSLGKVRKDSEGQIIEAQAIFMFFATKHYEAGQDADALSFEKEFLDVINGFQHDKIEALPYASRSFDDIADASMSNDTTMLAFGYLLVLAFVMIQLGKFNTVQQRAGLSIIGLLSVAMGLLSSMGLCLACGLMFTSMHGILPFLLLGIGIDDMFVIVQSFENLEDEELNRSLHDRMGLTMKHAGVAITITSITDLLAFGIGASTILPALSSFCIYAAIGIVFVFLYMVSFFLAWFAIDQRRAEAHRDAFICCWKKKNWTPYSCSQISLLEKFFELLAKGFAHWIIKVIILVITLTLLAFGIWGVVVLKTDFKVEWFLPEESYLRRYFEIQSEYFPSNGISGKVYLSELGQYHEKFSQIQTLHSNMQNLQGNLNPTSGSDAFHVQFIQFMNSNYYNGGGKNFPDDPVPETDFYEQLQVFLTTEGRRFVSELLFDGQLDPCATTSPPIKSLVIDYTHLRYESGTESIKKMNELTDFIKDQHKSLFDSKGEIFSHSDEYLNIIITEVITSELVRNILLALLCVFLATIVLISNIGVSIIVVLIVLLTLVEVGGFMHFWGLTIDTTAAILLTVAMGLSVDYAAHVGHYFMTVSGSRNDRVVTTVTKMGPAVFNGGFSTFLAFALLVTSSSYAFITFFKIFFLVVLFGLFNGLFVLPVILSVVGPSPIILHREKSGSSVRITGISPVVSVISRESSSSSTAQ